MGSQRPRYRDVVLERRRARANRHGLERRARLALGVEALGHRLSQELAPQGGVGLLMM